MHIFSHNVVLCLVCLMIHLFLLQFMILFKSFCKENLIRNVHLNDIDSYDDDFNNNEDIEQSGRLYHLQPINLVGTNSLPSEPSTVI